MNKLKTMGKKYWWAVAIGAFIIGAGSITSAKSRTEQITTDVKNKVGM